ncbi:TetR/AcrR family transcriptional regulator [Promicromonospora sukumoe]|uniref:AcrR family transcriptional regulator n=1 Tax=Promicromonospora sukumoe TaxID=88382 RepID=A0A7W3J8I3_9MICO|nr:TetR/AcrR family transcriptional regulator [Promicromonospora sukumoe]MBA8808205.1 AcrR family transcriptional regulator [Promicromonospora sukumoe]
MGDPGGERDRARTLDLLWGTRVPSGLGRKPGLGPEQIVAAGVAVADEGGLGSLSMRRVAERLGVGAMSLYRHVRDKAELLDLMVDRVLGEVRYDVGPDGVGPDGVGPGGDVPDGVGAGASGDTAPWRSRLDRVARANRALYERHPWLLSRPEGRPTLGPGVVAKYDAELRAVDGLGLGDVEMDLVLTLVLGYARDATASLVAWRSVPESTGQADDQWWAEHEPHMTRVLGDRYALAARVGTAATSGYGGVHDAERAWEFGLSRILDGIESFVRAGTGR